MYCCRARSDWKLSKAGCPGRLCHSLAVHHRGRAVDLGRYVLFKCSIGSQARVLVVKSNQRVHLTHDFYNLQKQLDHCYSSLHLVYNPPLTYLEELMDGLSDSLFVNSRVEVNQHARWLFLRRLELPSLALLGHFRRLLAINCVNTTPLLNPFVCWLRCFDDTSHRYKFLVTCGEEFEQFDFLFGIKLRT